MGLLFVIWLIAAMAFTLGWMVHSRIVKSRLTTLLETPPSTSSSVELIDLTTGAIAPSQTMPRR